MQVFPELNTVDDVLSLDANETRFYYDGYSGSGGRETTDVGKKAAILEAIGCQRYRAYQ
jgi:hypothetical protein